MPQSRIIIFMMQLTAKQLLHVDFTHRRSFSRLCSEMVMRHYIKILRIYDRIFKWSDILNILFFADICGRSGREAVFDRIYDLREEYNADVCIANGENAAGGFGLSRDTAYDLSRAGVDVFTMGNHVYSKKEIINLFDEYNIIRPYNLPKGDPGQGYFIFTAKNGEKLAVINLLGRLYMDLPVSNPFFAIDEVLEEIKGKAEHVVLDFHAEATSEKKAMGYYLDGRVSAVFGTHTHVQTADECILPNKTAYMTDVGMCGALHSVLGAKKEIAISRFTSAVYSRFEGAEGERRVNAVFIKTNKDGRAEEIVRINK